MERTVLPIACASVQCGFEVQCDVQTGGLECGHGRGRTWGAVWPPGRDWRGRPPGRRAARPCRATGGANRLVRSCWQACGPCQPGGSPRGHSVGRHRAGYGASLPTRLPTRCACTRDEMQDPRPLHAKTIAILHEPPGVPDATLMRGPRIATARGSPTTGSPPRPCRETSESRRAAYSVC